MAILIELCHIPERGPVELTISRSFEIKVTAAEAQAQVNQWLLNEVSTLIGADPPTLVVGEQIVWRVPAWIGFPHTGRAGIVGVVEVSVSTGTMNNTPELKAEIERRAMVLADNQPPFKPHTQIPAEYIASDVPPAPQLTIASDGTLHPTTMTE